MSFISNQRRLVTRAPLLISQLGWCGPHQVAGTPSTIEHRLPLLTGIDEDHPRR